MNGKEVAIEFKKALLEFKNGFRESLQGASDFPFLSKAEEALKELESILKNEWPWFLEERKNYGAELSVLIEEVVQPIQTFLKGPNAETWRKIDDWLRFNNENITEIAMPDAVQGIEACRESLDLYKTSETKHAKDLWQSLIQKGKVLVEGERAKAVERIEIEQAKLGFVEGWGDLPDPKRVELEKGFSELKTQLNTMKGLAALRDAATTQAPKLFESCRKKVHEILHPAEKIVYAGAEEKRVAFPRQELCTEIDVENYAKALAEHWKKLVRDGKRIGI